MICEFEDVTFGFYLLRCCRWILCAFHFNGLSFLFNEIKERIKKIKDENKVKKIELMTSWKTQFRPKGVVPKDPKLGGGGLLIIIYYYYF
ncbi:hypothetical protein NC652_036472 [Populus alba x Populus x berolinensis]|nr:hypothetical protein NC652_036472 [Populus alba x Populus x berolinensis]